MEAAQGIRARNRSAIESEILRIGREHLGRYGAAALSLRAVARDLGMASSAVYRYVDSRDELLTRLIVTAYDSLADAVDDALAQLPDFDGPGPSFRAIALATRRWAIAHPHEYALIYGSPVPNYDAPPERTTPAGTRVTNRLIQVLAPYADPDLETAQDRAALGQGPTDLPAQTGLDAGALRRGITAWNLVLGTITAELFSQYGPQVPRDAEAFFDATIDEALTIVRRPRPHRPSSTSARS
ncbi:MAG: TetR/AcrR family transcriptional regulator [Actinobacteria bacterium]|nr:TetR/AcrR family transcriptional regulator [Actinomycetota bacterium]MCG2803008.1 TetR/AcrR family transcriptional regulator [Cellulomonas sp.]